MENTLNKIKASKILKGFLLTKVNQFNMTKTNRWADKIQTISSSIKVSTVFLTQKEKTLGEILITLAVITNLNRSNYTQKSRNKMDLISKILKMEIKN